MATPPSRLMTTQAALEVVSCGSPLPGHEIRSRRRGRTRSPGAHRRAHRISWTVRDRAATTGIPPPPQSLFRGDWLDTGDVGYIADGELFLTSRAKDLIKRGGHNIHPYDLEAAVGRRPGHSQGLRGGVRHDGSRERNRARHRRGGDQPVGPGLVRGAARSDHGTRGHPSERSRRRRAARPRTHGAEDLERQDPPRRVSRALRKGTAESAAARRLAAARAPRRAAHSRRDCVAARRHWGKSAYGIYAWLVFFLHRLGGLVAPHASSTARRQRFASCPRSPRKRCSRSCGIPLDGGRPRAPAGQPGNGDRRQSRKLRRCVRSARRRSRTRLTSRPSANSQRVPLIGFVLRRLGTYFVERVDPAGGESRTPANWRPRSVGDKPSSCFPRERSRARRAWRHFASARSRSAPQPACRSFRSCFAERARCCASIAGFPSAIRWRSACSRPSCPSGATGRLPCGCAIRSATSCCAVAGSPTWRGDLRRSAVAARPRVLARLSMHAIRTARTVPRRHFKMRPPAAIRRG